MGSKFCRKRRRLEIDAKKQPEGSRDASAEMNGLVPAVANTFHWICGNVIRLPRWKTSKVTVVTA